MIEDWFESKWDCAIDFDIEDALQKLLAMELVEGSGGMFTAIPLDTGLVKLGRRWDDYFE